MWDLLRHGGDGVSLIEHLVRRHDVVAQERMLWIVPSADQHTAELRQVSRGDDA